MPNYIYDPVKPDVHYPITNAHRFKENGQEKWEFSLDETQFNRDDLLKHIEESLKSEVTDWKLVWDGAEHDFGLHGLDQTPTYRLVEN
jgi:hypothetical protein